MRTYPNNFFSHLTSEMGRYLNELVKEETFGLFRRGPQVVLAGTGIPSASDFVLSLQSHEITETEKGTFNIERPEGKVLVFRTPARIRVNFLLQSASSNSETLMRAYDRLTAHFFDQRLIAPFVSDSFGTCVEIREELRSQKAEIEIAGPSSAAPFQFLIQYFSLFHSGNPLREEVRTRSRVIDYGKSPSERSVL